MKSTSAWKTIPLGELCSIQSGASDTKDAVADGPYAFFDRSKTIKRSTRFLYDCEALIIPGEGTEFLPKQFCGKFDLHQRAYAIFDYRPELNIRFLFHYLHHRDDYFPSVAVGATVKSLRRRHFVDLPVPVPPLAEQQRIVTILDQAFAAIATAKANTEKNLANAHALFESHLQAVFTQRGEGWVERKVGDIAKYSFGKMLDKAKNRGTPQPYLRNINVRWFSVDLSDMLEMRFLPEEADKYTAVKGDVLICEGGYPGRCAIWNEDYPVYFQKALHRVRFHEPAHNKWLVYYLYLLDTSGQLHQHFTGSGIQHFTGEALGRLTLPTPPLLQIRRFVSLFEELQAKTQNLEAICKQKLAALDALKKSLLHQAFTGQLTSKQADKALETV